jgi:hypothetical protein
MPDDKVWLLLGTLPRNSFGDTVIGRKLRKRLKQNPQNKPNKGAINIWRLNPHFNKFEDAAILLDIDGFGI